MKTYFLDDEDMAFLDEVAKRMSDLSSELTGYHEGVEISDLSDTHLISRLHEMLRQLRKHAAPEFKMPGLKEPLPEGKTPWPKPTVEWNPQHAGQTPAVLPPRGPRPGEIVGGK